MATKFGVSCDIYTHVLRVDPEFAEYLRGTCTDESLRPGRRSGGATFLLPDKSNPVRKELEKLSASNNPDDMRKAQDIILALIIRDKIMTPADWQRTADIPNSMFPSRKVVTKKVDGQSVVLEGLSGDAIVKKDATFKDGSRKNNLAVWIVSGSGLSITTPEAARIVHNKTTKGSKTGSYEPQDDEIKRLRFQIAVIVENQAAHGGMTGRDRTVLERYAMGLVLHLKKECSNFYNDYFPLVSCSAADLYIFLEPHAPADRSDFLVPNEHIESWWSSKQQQFADMSEFCSIMCGNMPQDGYFNRDSRKVLLEVIEGERHDAASATPSDLVKHLEKIASEGKVSNDKKDGFLDILPDGCAKQYYSRHPRAMLVHNELRFSIVQQCSGLSKLSGEAFLTEFKSVIQWIANLLYTSNPGIIKGSSLSNVAKVFIQSDCFLYFYMTKDERDGLRHCTADPQIAAEKSKLFDATTFGQVLYKRLSDSNSIDAFLSSISGSITPENIERIREIVKQQEQ